MHPAKIYSQDLTMYVYTTQCCFPKMEGDNFVSTVYCPFLSVNGKLFFSYCALQC